MASTALFDLDGTVTDPQLGITNCIMHALCEVGVDVPPRRLLNDWIGAPLKQSFADYLSSEPLAEEALRHYRRRFVEKGMFENKLYEGIQDSLSLIREGVERSLIVTSKPTTFARQIIEHFKLDGFFDAVHGSELDGRFADKADLIEHVIDRHGFDPTNAIMVGDRRFDVLAAHAHGVRAIGVLWGFGSRDELQESGADLICETLPELPSNFAHLEV